MKQYRIFALLLLSSLPARAVELRSLAVDFQKFPGKTYFSELPDETIRESLGVRFDVDLGARFTWRANVHSFSTDAQFRWVGLEMEFGWQALPSLEILPWIHHSQHALDREQPDDHHFPVQDGFGFEWTLYRR